MSQTSETMEGKNQITEKSNYFNLFKNILFAILIVSLFYSFEFIPNFSDNYLEKIKEHKHAKSKRTDLLNQLKEYTQSTNPILFNKYEIERNNTNNIYNEFKKVKAEESVFGFKSFQLFATALFPIVAIFFYALYNLNRSYRVENRNIGIRLIHYVVLMFCFFQFFWIFKTFQDLPKYAYYLVTFLSTYFVGLAVYIIHIQENKIIKKLKNKLIKVSVYSLHYVEENKKEKMAQIIEEPI